MASSRGIIERLAQFVFELKLSDLPDPVKAEARRCVLDTVGVICAGQTTPLAASAAATVHAWGAAGDASLIGGKLRVSAPGATLINACAGHAQDYDDTSYTGIMHGSVAVLPAAFAIAETRGLGGAELLQAFIAGVETEYGVAELCTSHIYFRGWWTSGLYAGLGAAAAASKLLSLGEKQIGHALALALCQASGMKAGFGTDAKPLGIGLAASRGVECALFAQSGLNGPLDGFEQANGFLALYNDGLHAEDFEFEFGDRWRLLEPGILFKRFPVCSAAQAGAELSLDLMRRHSLSPRDVDAVDCEVPELVRVSLVYDQPDSIRQAQFSMPFAIGCMLAYGDLGLEQLNPAILQDEVLRRQMNKVSMHVPDHLRNDAQVLQRSPEGAGVTLVTADGRRYSDFLERPTGMPGNPISDAALEDKFRRCLAYAGFGDARAHELADQYWQLEGVSDLRGLVD